MASETVKGAVPAQGGSEESAPQRRAQYEEAAQAFKDFADRRKSQRKLMAIQSGGANDTHFFILMKDGTLPKHMEYFKRILALARPERRGQREIVPDVEINDEELLDEKGLPAEYRGGKEEEAPEAEDTLPLMPAADGIAAAYSDGEEESNPAKAFLLGVAQQFQLAVARKQDEGENEPYAVKRFNWLFEYDIPYKGRISISFNRVIPGISDFVAGIKAYFSPREFSKICGFSSGIVASLYVFLAFAVNREYERVASDRTRASRFTANVPVPLQELMNAYLVHEDAQQFMDEILLPALAEINRAAFGKYDVSVEEEDGIAHFRIRFGGSHPLVVYERMSKVNPVGERGYVVSKEYLLQSEFPYNGVPSADDVGLPGLVVASDSETFSVQIMDDSHPEDEEFEVVKFSKVTKENVASGIYNGLLQYFASADEVLYYFQSKAATQELQRAISRYDLLDLETVNKIKELLAEEEALGH